MLQRIQAGTWPAAATVCARYGRWTAALAAAANEEVTEASDHDAS